MSNQPSFRVCVLPGDGIGVEVTEAAVAVLQAAERRIGGFRLQHDEHRAGAMAYRDTGTSKSEETWRAAEVADATLLGAMGWPEIRHPDGTEIASQIDLRIRVGLYAGVGPVRAIAEAFAGGPVRTFDAGGRDGTAAVTRAMIAALEA